MKHIFLLSGDFVELAKEEILSLFDIKNYNLIGRLLIADLGNIDKNLSKRLALTKGIFESLFECKINELEKIMKSFIWNSVYSGNFCLRIHNFDINNKKNPITKESINAKSNKNFKNKNIKKYSEKELAKHVWRSVQNPKVNLENPKTKIGLFFSGDNVYCGLGIFENNENLESRKSHLRPFPNPSSLHPKLARALVNISGIRENNSLLDPFCGTGGFLIEAGLMGIKSVGYDISRNMADGCKANLKYFKIKDYKIINRNALNIDKKIDYVITDLPYGLNSNVYLEFSKKSLKNQSNKINLKTNKKGQIKNIENFYLKFLKKLRKVLKKKAVIIFPSYVNYKKLIKNSGFKVEREFSVYVHRSLTRKVVKIS